MYVEIKLRSMGRNMITTNLYKGILFEISLKDNHLKNIVYGVLTTENGKSFINKCLPTSINFYSIHYYYMADISFILSIV